MPKPSNHSIQTIYTSYILCWPILEPVLEPVWVTCWASLIRGCPPWSVLFSFFFFKLCRCTCMIQWWERGKIFAVSVCLLAVATQHYLWLLITQLNSVLVGSPWVVIVAVSPQQKISLFLTFNAIATQEYIQPWYMQLDDCSQHNNSHFISCLGV